MKLDERSIKLSRAIKAQSLLVIFFFIVAIGGVGRCEAQTSEQSRVDDKGTPLRATELTTPHFTPIPITYSATAALPVKQNVDKKLWRIVIIGAGSFPFTLFYTNFIFDSVRFATHSFDVQYAPWPFKTQYSAAVSTGETFLRLGVSAGIGVIIGIIDQVVQRR